MSNTSVYGLYTTRTAVEHAVDRLKNEGFRNTDISVLFPHNEGNKEFAIQNETKAPEGAVAGAGTGAIAGGALGWLAGIGALAIPGIGPFVAAGPIMAALSGITVGGVLGGLTGGLIGMGMPEFEAKRFAGRIEKGGILLSVHSDDTPWTVKAKRILHDTGAEDVSASGEAAAKTVVTEHALPRRDTY